MSPDLKWRKSSHSAGNNGDCVELAYVSKLGAVRDSKNPNGPTLVVDLAEFVQSVKAGRFDG